MVRDTTCCKPHAQNSDAFSLNIIFIKRLWRVSKIMFPGFRSPTILLFLFLFLLLILDQVITYYVGIIASHFYVILGSRDNTGFRYTAIKSGLIVMAKVLVFATISYVASVLYIDWRRSICRRLHANYFSAKMFYIVNVVYAAESCSIDNPDQRMTQDVEKMCNTMSNIFWQLIIAPFIVAYYTFKTYQSTGYLGPLVIYGFFILGSIINRAIMNPIVKLVVAQERAEGNFRYKHMSVRSNAESIAFYSSGPLEGRLTNSSLDKLLKIQSKLILWRYFLQFSTSSFDYLGSILSYLILGFAIFTLGKFGDASSADLAGIVSRNSFFYMYLINSFTKIIDLSTKFSDFAGCLHRVGEMFEFMQLHASDYDNTNELIQFPHGNTPNPGAYPGPLIRNDSSPESSAQPIFPSVSDTSIEHGYTIDTVSILCDDHIDSTDVVNVSSSNTMHRWHDVPNYCSIFDDERAFDVRNLTFEAPLHANEKNVTALSVSENTITPPRLVSNLTFSVVKNKYLLITGDSSSGKTSLLRIIAGLWSGVSGAIDVYLPRHEPSQLLFLPQKPYLLLQSTLRQQMIYPSYLPSAKSNNRALITPEPTSMPESDELNKLARLLEIVGLSSLQQRCKGWDTTVDWSWQDVLSPGEAQRLAFTRVLYHRPKYCFLDEATSAVGADMENRLYSELLSNGITYVSVGHRASLRRYHNVELRLTGDGGWSLNNVANNSMDSILQQESTE